MFIDTFPVSICLIKSLTKCRGAASSVESPIQKPHYPDSVKLFEYYILKKFETK